MDSILSISATAQGRLIENGEISSAELIELHLARIGQVQSTLNATSETLTETARQAARMADERRASGVRLSPIDGVPFSVKDSIEVEGTVCTAGTLGFRNAAPSTQDATFSSPSPRGRSDSHCPHKPAGSPFCL